MIDGNLIVSPDPAGDGAQSPGKAEGQARPSIKVLFPLPLSDPFDYLLPEEMAAQPVPIGSFVLAPFGKNEKIGVVWGVDRQKNETLSDTQGAPRKPGEESARSLKTIVHGFNADPLPTDVMDFVTWVAAYTMAPLGSVLRMVMRSGDFLAPPKSLTAFGLAAGPSPGLRMTPARERIVSVLTTSQVLTASEIAQRADVSPGVVTGFAKVGGLKTEAIDPDAAFPVPDPGRPGRDLSQDQRDAVEIIAQGMKLAEPPPVLIDGVTGAGKTEVYLEAVALALQADPSAQALIMLPEIALTVPFLKRIAERFDAEPAAWHSDMTGAQRRRVWRRVLDGNARIVVGARSALFLPYPNLRLIVVDEEHEAAYKQEDGVVYQARDMAVARGAKGKFPVLLASATPSLETVMNVAHGRYEIVRLTRRFGAAQLPKVNSIDLRHEGPETGRWLSAPLVTAVNQRLAAGEQSLLFLNRRGYAPLTICRRCGHRMKAPDSDTWLVEHRFENKLVCHHTGFSMEKPAACPECKTVGSLSACGPGIERVAEEARERWPEARHAVLSSDLVASPARMRELLDAMEAGAIDILVATQMIAKGHHFPNLTLVGVVDADMGLSGGDLRAGERTFQLLSQVAGRAGRAEKPGEVLLQSYHPDVPVLTALADHDRDAFLEAEAGEREQAGFPPFGRLAAIVLRSANETALREMAARHRAALPKGDGIEVWGPAPAPIYRLRGEARMRFLVKTRRDVNVQGFISAWLKKVKLAGPVRRTVDIDPYSFL
ncbi:MAG: primosomal protein N' [Pseudomonadota bacterium]